MSLQKHWPLSKLVTIIVRVIPTPRDETKLCEKCQCEITNNDDDPAQNYSSPSSTYQPKSSCDEIWEWIEDIYDILYKLLIIVAMCLNLRKSSSDCIVLIVGIPLQISAAQGNRMCSQSLREMVHLYNFV